MTRLEGDVFPVIRSLDIEALTPLYADYDEQDPGSHATETARRAIQAANQILIYADLPDITVSQRKKLPAYKRPPPCSLSRSVVRSSPSLRNSTRSPAHI